MSKLQLVLGFFIYWVVPFLVLINGVDRISNAQTEFELLRSIAYSALLISVTSYLQTRGKKNG